MNADAPRRTAMSAAVTRHVDSSKESAATSSHALEPEVRFGERLFDPDPAGWRVDRAR